MLHNPHKSTTLQKRLILFISLVTLGVILLFTLLLQLFGVAGSGRQTVMRYLESELTHIAVAMERDMGTLSATGIQLAQSLSQSGDAFFSEYGIAPSELSSARDAVEPLLSGQMPTLLSAAENTVCGGAFIVLDASVSVPEGGVERQAGIFLKKTQPVSSAALSAKTYCLRGPAALSRAHRVELLGQWKMEFDESELAFFRTTVETARKNPELPLSKLCFWSDRHCLNGSSEQGLLLCVPLRSADGTVWGVCGFEVSDRMFKQLYSPSESEYDGVFATLSPRDADTLYADRGLIAGNAYLTGNQLRKALTFTGVERGFPCFTSTQEHYGGKTETIRLYSNDSPYEQEIWAAAVLMPRSYLKSAVIGKSATLFTLSALLMLLSFAASVYVSKRYLRPIQQSLSSIRENGYENGIAGVGIAEVDRLFEKIAEDIRLQRTEAERLAREKRDAEAQLEKAQAQMDRLTQQYREEIDPQEYAAFLDHLRKLTATERKIFDAYLEGKSTDEILRSQGIKETTLKYHNRNIFSKLGVASRKQLVQLAAEMQFGAERVR